MSETAAQKELQETYNEAVAGERVFDTKAFGRLRLRFPNNQERLNGELEYSKKFTELLDTNLKTRREMDALLKDRGIWTEKEDLELERLRSELEVAFEALVKAKNEKAKDAASKRALDIQKQLTALQASRMQYLENTVEVKSDEHKNAYLISCVCTKVDPDTGQDTGERLWPTFEAYVNEQSTSGVIEVWYHWISFSSGLTNAFLGLLPTDGEEPDKSGE
jgi:predicted ATPase